MCIHNQIVNVSTRRTTFQGRTHLVAPVVLMTEGVHHGSVGRILYTAQELSRMPMTWHGRPVPIMHPTDNNGMPRSCNDPDVLEAQSVGRVFNVQWESANRRLTGEIWIDEQKAREVCNRMGLPDVINMIQQNQPVEVSTGLFPERNGQGGVWNGQEYDATAVGIHSDHLALLPGGQGACSWEDGCGVRNENGRQTPMERTRYPGQNNQNQNQGKEHPLQANQNQNQGYRELVYSMQSKLDGMDSEIRIHFLEELFDEYLVYRVANRETGDETYYRRPYSLNQDGTIEFQGEPEPVRKQVEFVPVQQQQSQNENTDQEGENMGDKKTPQNHNQEGCCPEKVTAVINSEANGFTENDRHKLLAWNEEDLDKIPVDEVQMQNQDGDGDRKKVAGQQPQAQNQGGGEQPQPQQHQPSFDELLQNASPEYRESINRGLQLYREERQNLVQTIMANSNQWTQQELDGMDHTMLQKLANSMPQPVNHRLRGGGSSASAEEQYEEGIGMPHVQNEFEPKTDKKQ